MGGGGGGSGQCLARNALLALALGCLLAQPCSTSFFFGLRWAYTPQSQSRGDREEKVPMTVAAAPDFSPRPAPLRLPCPAWTRTTCRVCRPRGGSPARRPATTAPAPTGATSTDFISSSPAVPLPAGITDSATVLPMPTPGQHRRDDVGMGALQLEARRAVQLAVPLLVMLSLGALW